MDVSQIFHPLNMTPQPPPPPPPPSSSSPVASFPILTISIIGIFAITLLLLGYYLFVTKCWLNWRRPNALGLLALSSRRLYWRAEPQSEDYSIHVAEHRGLEESAIQAIPTLNYRKISGRGGGAAAVDSAAFHECAVCLNEFQEEERIRLLPSCFHVFHIDCIDTWLQTQASCPLCRSSITSSAPIQADALMAAALVPYHGPLRSEDIVIEVGEDQSGAIGETNSSSTKSELRFQLQAKRSRKLSQFNSMGDECIETVRRSQDQQFKAEQPILRRSFSLDSSGDAQLYMAAQKILKRNPHYFQDAVALAITTGESGGGSTSTTTTTSGRPRRSFFSFGRSSRGASVLPIQFEP